MAKSTSLSLALALACGTALPATAMPTTAPMPPAATHIIQIATSCGPGSTRDARGVCRHRFNLFRHHDRFQAYKKQHCKPVNTPNGRVGFCHI